jgi:hypothetical protein
VDIAAGTVFCTDTLIMTSEFVTAPEQEMTCAMIWLSVRVPVHGLVQDPLHELLQVGDAVPDAPFNWAIRAANVAAVCAFREAL